MTTRLGLTTLLATALALWTHGVSTDAECVDLLEVRKLTVRTRGGSARDRVRLAATLSGAGELAFDPAADDLVVTIDGIEVFAIPPVEARGKLRRISRKRWRYTGPRSAGRPRLVLDPGNAKLRLRVRADLSALRESTATTTEVAVRVGGDEWMSVNEIYATSRGLNVAPGFSALSPVPVGFVLAATVWGDPEREPTVIRTQAEWDALLPSLLVDGAPPEAIDFEERMLLVSFDGCPFEGAELPTVTQTVDGLHVLWRHADDVCVGVPESPPPARALAVLVPACSRPVVFETPPHVNIERE